MPALEDQVALVTGGGSGIGLGIVKRFAAEGARVMVLERVPERVKELEAELGGSVKAVQGDVTQLADNQRAVSEAVSAFGKLDIFIANAGVFDRFRRLDEIDDEILESAFDHGICCREPPIMNQVTNQMLAHPFFRRQANIFTSNFIINNRVAFIIRTDIEVIGR